MNIEVINYAVFVVLAALFLAPWPVVVTGLTSHRVARAELAFSRYRWRTLALGAVNGLFLTGIALLLFAASEALGGGAVALIAWGFTGLVLVIALIGATGLIRQMAGRLFPDAGAPGAILRTSLAVWVACAFPFAGWLLFFIILTWGLGAFVLSWILRPGASPP
jgi:hypothetical protein